MDERDVRLLLAEVAAKVNPTTQDDDAVWNNARSRLHRRRALITAGSVVAAVTVVIAATQLGPQNVRGGADPATSGPPTATTEAPTPTATPTEPEPTAQGVTPAVVQHVWTRSTYATLPEADTPIPPSLGSVPDTAVALSANPKPAVAAVQVPDKDGGGIYVLGTDQEWRLVDVPRIEPAQDAGGYQGPALQVTSLSTDGTHLALPQPQALIVVDLANGSSRRYDVPGYNQEAIWAPDGNHVLVGTEESNNGTLVDLEDGSLSETVFEPLHSGYAPDGRIVELWSQADDSPPYEMRTYPTTGETTSVRIDVNLQSAFGNTVAAHDKAIAMTNEDKPFGATILDPSSGDALAHITVRDYGMLYQTTPLGWLDAETLVVRFAKDVVAWNYKTEDLTAITHLTSGAATLSIAG